MGLNLSFSSGRRHAGSCSGDLLMHPSVLWEMNPNWEQILLCLLQILPSSPSPERILGKRPWKVSSPLYPMPSSGCRIIYFLQFLWPRKTSLLPVAGQLCDEGPLLKIVHPRGCSNGGSCRELHARAKFGLCCLQKSICDQWGELSFSPLRENPWLIDFGPFLKIIF